MLWCIFLKVKTGFKFGKWRSFELICFWRMGDNYGCLTFDCRLAEVRVPTIRRWQTNAFCVDLFFLKKGREQWIFRVWSSPRWFECRRKVFACDNQCLNVVLQIWVPTHSFSVNQPTQMRYALQLPPWFFPLGKCSFYKNFLSSNFFESTRFTSFYCSSSWSVQL